MIPLSCKNNGPEGSNSLKPLLVFLLSFYLCFIPCLYAVSIAADTFYSIQLGSFNDLENADEMVKGLKKLGHNAFYREEKSEQKTVFRVYIEKFDSESEAEKEARIMKELDLIDGYTIQELSNNNQKIKEESLSLPSVYYLQVSALKEKENAEKTVEKLKKSGRDAFYRKETVPGKGEFYKVYIQGFNSRKDALKEARILKDSGLIDEYIIRYQKAN